MMSRTPFLVRVGFLGFLIYGWVGTQSRVSAFSLSDHTLITEYAVQEFNLCKAVFSEKDLEVLDGANRWEDLNLLKKWSQYSHYYRPLETLDFLWRSDSSRRVGDLGAELTLEGVGGILHYLQDAASPPHVVPVTHGSGDGFENYVLSNAELLHLPLEGLREQCPELLRPTSVNDPFLSLLVETGLSTLDVLSKERIQVDSSSGKRELRADFFWSESPKKTPQGKRSFGRYGRLGDSFGRKSIVLEGVAYTVAASEYDRFKLKQLRLAIDASKKALSVWTHAK